MLISQYCLVVIKNKTNSVVNKEDQFDPVIHSH